MRKALPVIIGIVVLLAIVFLGKGNKDVRTPPIPPDLATATAGFERYQQTVIARWSVTPDLTPWPTPTPLPPIAPYIAQATATAWAYSVQRHNAMIPTAMPGQ